MEDLGKRVDIQNLLSLGDDLIAVLNNKKDADNLMQSLEGAKRLHSACQVDADEVTNLLDDYEKKVEACKVNIEKARSDIVADAELEQLQSELEEKLRTDRLLRQELRILSDDLTSLEHQRVSIEERKENIKRKEKENIRTQDLLSMCASVTNIIPSLDDQRGISGYVVDRNKKKVQKFDFQPSESPFEVCKKLWKMANV